MDISFTAEEKKEPRKINKKFIFLVIFLVIAIGVALFLGVDGFEIRENIASDSSARD